MTNSLKVAETLSFTSPVETAITPPARMAEMRARLSAVRQATNAIRPTFTQFYDALDQGTEGPVCRDAMKLPARSDENCYPACCCTALSLASPCTS